jgi:hypothetical protein
MKTMESLWRPIRIAGAGAALTSLSLLPLHPMEALSSPLSSRAYRDFLPRSTRQGHVCAFQ